MNKKVLIRKCEIRDIPALRDLAADTAYFGESCEYFFPDRELLADLIMGYYLLYEPEHTWVAEYDGNIVGYLSAGMNEKRYTLYMIGNIIPKALLKAFLRGKIWNIKTLKLIKYNILCFLRRETSMKKVCPKKYRVHIHQNVKVNYRGKKIGSELVEKFLEYIEPKKAGIRFKALRQENRFNFFEKYGFRLHDCKRVPTWEQWLNKSPLYYMEYVRDPGS